MLILAVIVLFPGAVFRGDAIVPGELQFMYHPWRLEFPKEVNPSSNWILFDELLEFHPWREFLSHHIRHGRIPLWDPTAFCGYPFQGLYQTGLLYPPDRLSDGLDFASYTLFRALFHFLLAGIGTALYLIRRKLNIYAVTFGMCAFGLSGFIIVWLGHPHAKTAAWLPWLFLGIDLLLGRSRAAIPVLLTATACTLMSGHIETALHTLSAAALYCILLMFQRRHRRLRQSGIQPLGIVCIISALLAGAMILPFAEYLSQSVAYATRAEGIIMQGWLDRILAVTMLMPKIIGSSADGTYWYPGFNSAETGGAFIGVTTIVLALGALCSGISSVIRRTHLIIVLLTALTVFGIPPIYQIVSSLPGFKMSYNFRLVLPMVFSLVILAATMIQDLTSSDRPDRKRPLLLSGLLVVCTAASGAWYLDGLYPDKMTDSALHHVIAVTGIAAAVTLAVPLLLRVVSLRFGFAFTLIVLIELIGFGRGFNPETAPETLKILPESAGMLKLKTSQDMFRVLPVGKTYPPHLCLRMGMHDIRGNDALTPLVTEDYVALMDPGIRHKHRLPALRMMWLNTWQSPLLDVLNVKYIVIPISDIDAAPPDLIPLKTVGGVHVFINPGYLERVFTVDSWVYGATDTDVLMMLQNAELDLSRTAIVKGNGKPRHSPESLRHDTVNITEYDLHRIDMDVDVEQPSLLVLSDTYFPGWNAYINGQKTDCLQVNHMMRGIQVNAETRRVVFRFEPLSWTLGVFLSLLGVLLIPLALMCTKLSLPTGAGK